MQSIVCNFLTYLYVIFWLPFENRYTHTGEGLCQISHFIPEVNDFRLSSFALSAFALETTTLWNFKKKICTYEANASAKRNIVKQLNS